jgi:hypothetical protein
MQVGDLVMLPSSLGYIRDKGHLKLIGIVYHEYEKRVSSASGYTSVPMVRVQWSNGNRCMYQPKYLELLCK